MSEKQIKEAMQHPYKLGAGAKKRKKLSPKDTITAVMREWKRGTLMGGAGNNVTDQKQAIAIALSEASNKGKRKGK